MKQVSIVIVDDHAVVREGLRTLLRGYQGMEIVGEASDGWEALELVQRSKPDVVLVDLAMPRLNGFAATREILRKAPKTKILVLSSSSDEECVLALLEAGAAGFLSKLVVADDLVKAIHEVNNGGKAFTPEIGRRLRESRQTFPPWQHVSKGCTLSPREAEVLQLIAHGWSNRGAAAKLGISIKTIEKHRQGVMNKLNIHEAAGLTGYAVAREIVSDADPSAN